MMKGARYETSDAQKEQAKVREAVAAAVIEMKANLAMRELQRHKRQTARELQRRWRLIQKSIQTL